MALTGCADATTSGSVGALGLMGDEEFLVETVEDGSHEFLRVLLCVASKHRVDDLDGAEDF